MSGRDGGASPGDKEPPPEASAEAIAKFLVTQFARNVAGATATWSQKTAEAFEASFCKALEGTYTADDLANDAAGVWARGIRFIEDLPKFKNPAVEAAHRDRNGGQPGSTRA